VQGDRAVGARHAADLEVLGERVAARRDQREVRRADVRQRDGPLAVRRDQDHEGRRAPAPAAAQQLDL
jgi:hypothetical protein